jgi:hypothetical protein
MIDLRPLLADHKSKMFFAMRGVTDPFKIPNNKGAHPPLTPPLFTFLIGGGAKK